MIALLLALLVCDHTGGIDAPRTDADFAARAAPESSAADSPCTYRMPSSPAGASVVLVTRAWCGVNFKDGDSSWASSQEAHFASFHDSVPCALKALDGVDPSDFIGLWKIDGARVELVPRTVESVRMQEIRETEWKWSVKP